ncbi:MAG: 30S ribosomal protein S21 [Gemmatimonadaceae bacterium]|jgi:small subunit ribosomal protein S21|nr:30S ribosomal protein S21 [Gemmatimonadaceae bacterium]
MVEVIIADGDSVDRALKQFKKQVLRAGILKDLRKRRHYVKPSEARQLKAAAARRRQSEPRSRRA